MVELVLQYQLQISYWILRLLRELEKRRLKLQGKKHEQISLTFVFCSYYETLTRYYNNLIYINVL